MGNLFQSDWSRRFYTSHWAKLWLTQAIVLLIVGFAIAWSVKGTPAPNSGETGSEGHAQHAAAAKILDVLHAPSNSAQWSGEVPSLRNGPGAGDCVCGRHSDNYDQPHRSKADENLDDARGAALCHC